jgi:hypothetical protein
MVSDGSVDEILRAFDVLNEEPFEACEQEWLKCLQGLRLSVTYVPAVEEVLDQGRWRNAPNPLAYVRKAAVRQAVRMRLFDFTQRDPKRELVISDVNVRDVNGSLVPHDVAIDVLNHEFEEKHGNYDQRYECSPVLGVSDSLYADSGPREIDWDQVAELAGLDEGEKLVIEVRLLGLGREQALELCLTKKDHLLLQAAWKRFERHQGALKATLESGEPHRARRILRSNSEPPMDLVLVRTRQVTNISFRNLVPLVPK